MIITAWIESHQGLRDHPKTKRLVRYLTITLPAAIGHLHSFWWWALDHAQDGCLDKYDAFDIADGAAWDGDAEIFLKGMVDAGFIDEENGVYIIHDWMDYAGRLIERRQKDAERKRKDRDVHGMSDGQSTESIRNRTLTVPKPKENKKDIYPDTFEKFYELYPNPANKMQTFSNWKNVIKKVDSEELNRAAKRYAKNVQGKDKQFIVVSSNFIGKKAVYLDYLDDTYAEPPLPKIEDKPSADYSHLSQNQRRALGLSRGGA